MKTNKINALFAIILAASSLLYVSCTADYRPAATAKVFSASFADMAETKVYADSFNAMHWTHGDRISVFGSQTGECYSFDGMTGDNAGTFSKDGSVTTPTWSKYYAIYPFNASTVATAEGTFTCTIPETQQYVCDGFDPEAALMVARTADINSTDLKFFNTCAFLRVKVYSESNAVIRRLYLTGNDYECLSGTGTLTVDADGIPAIQLAADFNNTIGGSSDGFSNETGTGGAGTKAPEGGNTGSRRVIIDCGEAGVKVGASKETATSFIFAVAPGTFADGFKVVTEDITGATNSMVTRKSFDLARSSISTMAPYRLDMVGGGLELTSFSLTTPSNKTYTASTIGNNTINLLIPSSVDKSNLKVSFETTGYEVYIGAVKQESGVTTNDFSGTVTYTVKNVSGDSRDYRINIQSAPKLIACWGDSFTHYTNDTTCYPPRLKEMLGSTWDLYDGGISGDRSNEIAARQGAIKTIIRKTGGFNFPAGTSEVSITTVNTLDRSLDPTAEFRPSRWTYSTRGLNNCYVGGVECQLAYNALRRVTPGEAVHVQDSAVITTYGAAHCKDADVIIIYMGTNGGWQQDAKNYDLLIAQHKAMIEFTTNKKYIIMASHVPQGHGFVFHGGDDEVYLKKMKEAFGDHVIFLRSAVNSRAEEFLVRTGVCQDASEMSAADRRYISEGNWPLSFLVSESNWHPSKYGSTAMAILIMEKMKELGYLDE